MGGPSSAPVVIDGEEDRRDANLRAGRVALVHVLRDVAGGTVCLERRQVVTSSQRCGSPCSSRMQYTGDGIGQSSCQLLEAAFDLVSESAREAASEQRSEFRRAHEQIDARAFASSPSPFDAREPRFSADLDRLSVLNGRVGFPQFPQFPQPLLTVLLTRYAAPPLYPFAVQWQCRRICLLALPRHRAEVSQSLRRDRYRAADTTGARTARSTAPREFPPATIRAHPLPLEEVELLHPRALHARDD